MEGKNIIFSIVLFFMISGCTSTAKLEDNISRLEKRLNDISADCRNRRIPVDINRDGIITRDEYEARLRNIFSVQIKWLDYDRDNRISEKELVSEKKSTNLFRLYDKNKDGFITFDEFVGYFDKRFNVSDRNNDGVISMQDVGLVDKNSDGIIDINEYRDTVYEFFNELNKSDAIRGYGYSCSHSRFVICDPSCVRCIALFVPWYGGSGGYVTPGSHEDRCANVCCDPWDEKCDPYDSCCDAF